MGDRPGLKTSTMHKKPLEPEMNASDHPPPLSHFVRTAIKKDAHFTEED
jgi:hypothetical protein